MTQVTSLRQRPAVLLGLAMSLGLTQLFGLLFIASAAAFDSPPDRPETSGSEVAATRGQTDSAPTERRLILITGASTDGPDLSQEIRETLGESNIADRVTVEVIGEERDWSRLTENRSKIAAVVVASPPQEERQIARLRQAAEQGAGLILIGQEYFTAEAKAVDLAGPFGTPNSGTSGSNSQAAAVPRAQATPVKGHPIGRGVTPFEWSGIVPASFAAPKNDSTVKPLLTVRRGNGKNASAEAGRAVAWAADDKGQRRVLLANSDFASAWKIEANRTLLLNAICWTAKLEVPAGGVGRDLEFDDQWTPKPHLGKSDLPKESEADWRDARLQEMDTGPFFTSSILVPEPGAEPEKPKDDRKGPADPNMVVKALAVRFGANGGSQGGVLYDKTAMVLRCGWEGRFLQHSDRRFGLLEAPAVGNRTSWSTANGEGWTAARSEDAKPVPAAVEYRGLRLDGDRVLLEYEVDGCRIRETPSRREPGGQSVVVRSFEIGPLRSSLTTPLASWPGATGSTDGRDAVLMWDDQAIALSLRTDGGKDSGTATLVSPAEGDCRLRIGPSAQPQKFDLIYWQGSAADRKNAQAAIDRMTISKPFDRFGTAPRWGEPLRTVGALGDAGTLRDASTLSDASPLGQAGPDAPFEVDTITLPDGNRYGALLFASGFDFMPNGIAYLCTAHGDVWKVTGIDDSLRQITWQRFATGLYQPLGLKIRDGEIFVLGRDQITRLHDTNNDGEADHYENFNDDLTDSGQSHAYAMCLETDAAGNFYLLKSGAPDTPHGGSLIQVSADGSKLTVYATGFRHANGLSIGPEGTITAADNEGNWVPATRLDFVERGGFYGHVPTSHLPETPEEPGEPLCWLPRVIDNSAGGQVWVPEGQWGTLSGKLLHLSFGQCTASVILKERVQGVWQGGAVRLPTPLFLSGVCRGRFRTTGRGADGHLYVCGLNGWSSAAERDGCFQRVRYLDRPIPLPTAVHVSQGAIDLEFAEPLDETLAANPSRYAVEIWNYRWTRDYGSADYSIADPAETGRDAVPVVAAKLSKDGRRIRLSVPEIQPAMQLRVQAGLRTRGGQPLVVDYYGTVHHLGQSGGSVSSIEERLQGRDR